MKVLALLSLLGLVAAEPQLLMPYSSTGLVSPYVGTTFNSPRVLTYTGSSAPVVTPTFNTIANTPLINTYTASYPYTGFGSIQAALPTTYRYPSFTSPIITTGNTPSTIVSSRQKRSAEPEPEADPALLYTTNPGYNWALPAVNQYSVPAAVTTYSYPAQTFPTTGITYAAPFTGFTNIGSNPIVSPYSAFPMWAPVVPATGALATPAAVETPKPVETTRTKRSADPEADPQLLTTGFTGFSYPAINTRTTPNAITYTGIPATSTALTYSNLFPRTNWPTTYTSGLPISYGTYPAGTTFIAGI